MKTQDIKRSTSDSGTLNLQERWNQAIPTVPAFMPSILAQLIRLDIELVFSQILPFSQPTSRICKTLKPLVLLGSSDYVLGCGGRTGAYRYAIRRPALPGLRHLKSSHLSPPAVGWYSEVISGHFWSLAETFVQKMRKNNGRKNDAATFFRPKVQCSVISIRYPASFRLDPYLTVTLTFLNTPFWA